MLRTWRKPSQLFSDFNSLQFASVMALVVFVILLVFMTETRPFHHRGPDLPKVSHAASMPGALREDCMKVTVTRDGKIYIGVEQVVGSAGVKDKILERLQDHDVERKVYLAADMRARWDSVRQALEGIRSAGILRVAFLVR